MKVSNLFYTTACVASLSAVAAYALTGDGTVGDTSTGTLDVKLKIQERVNITNLADLDLGTFDPDGTDEEANEEFCVYYNNATDVLITLSSANANGGFNMVDQGNGGTNLVPYTVGVNVSPSTSGTYTSHGEAATIAYTTANTAADDNCVTVGADTTAISVTVADAGGTLGVPSDDYLDTITIKVEPNP